MPWIKRKLRGNTVYAKVDSDGKLDTDSGGRVEIVYKLVDGAKSYRASSRNLEETGDAKDNAVIETTIDVADASKPGKGKQKSSSGPSQAIPENAVVVYTDGACTGNPGPMGIGAVIMDGDKREEISEYIGKGTNNIAELTAILRSLESMDVDQKSRPIVIHTDSSYSIGILDKGWKAKANVELIASMRTLLKSFADVSFVKVKGHAGIPENERCDELATSAIQNR